MATSTKKTKSKSSKGRAASTAKKLSGSSKPSSKKSTPTTTITVKYDVGFANGIFLRGSGANLSWDKGIELKNVSPDEWQWSTRRKFDAAEFKVLINDQLFEIGDNHSICCGDKVTITPHF